MSDKFEFTGRYTVFCISDIGWMHWSTYNEEDDAMDARDRLISGGIFSTVIPEAFKENGKYRVYPDSNGDFPK